MRLPPLAAATLGPVVAAIVFRAGLLTIGGAVAAAGLGSATTLAGLDWMALLLLFFVSSVLLGRLGRDEKQRRSAAIIDKPGPRDSLQVLANGALFGCGALAAATGHLTDTVAAAALGGLAAATADTWGTEIGMLSRTPPHSIISWTTLEPGMSGGVSTLGLLATAGGTIALAGAASLLRWPSAVCAAGAIGGFGGAMADSVLGATVQARRRTVGTGALTERTKDDDGTPTVAAGGVTWLDNDGVNFGATVIGGSIAAAVYSLLS